MYYQTRKNKYRHEFGARVERAKKIFLTKFLLTENIFRKVFRIQENTQIVICGYPRSGTSLFYNMLSSSVEEFECYPFEVPCLEVINKSGNIVTKRPMDVFSINRLLERNTLRKRIVVVVVIRDIRDLVTSIHPNVPDDYFINSASSYKVGAAHPYSPTLSHPGILSYAKAISSIRKLYGLQSVFVKFEDIVNSPDAIQAQLASNVGLHFTSMFKTFHERKTKHAYQYAGQYKPIDHSRVREQDKIDVNREGKWRKEKHQSRILSEFSNPDMRELLVEYGYESNDQWYIDLSEKQHE